ncbi:MAG: glycosyltransferase family 4 protein [Burkholderiales bacterium]
MVISFEPTVMAEASPWVIVAGGFHQHGGMDRANAALASYLLGTGAPVHLVGHEIDPELARHRMATAYGVPRPKGMPAIAERLLARTGVRVARSVVNQTPRARVVVNGGNCPWPDINWVHALHAAWPVLDGGAPWWSRHRNRRLKASAQLRERKALRKAGMIIANSHATSRAIIEHIGIDPARVRTVYLGSDPAWGAPTVDERAAARAELGLRDGVPVVLFAGALGSDINKGFHLLWEAWQQLTASSTWDASLVVAGDGWRLRHWQAAAVRAGLTPSVRFLGWTTRMRAVLAAGDLLVSPVRYEAYGLNVHEALCRGLGVMVTRTAGVVERFDGVMSEAVLPERVTAAVLADRLRLWRADVDGWRLRASSTAACLRARSWTDMAAELVGVAEQTAERIPA